MHLHVSCGVCDVCAFARVCCGMCDICAFAHVSDVCAFTCVCDVCAFERVCCGVCVMYVLWCVCGEWDGRIFPMLSY